MKLTLSPFASRIRSPGLSRPCLSMNESMMILATITWKHFLKNSFLKKQKSEAAELTLSKCAGLVSIPYYTICMISSDAFYIIKRFPYLCLWTVPNR